jgi:hypothetical protein
VQGYVDLQLSANLLLSEYIYRNGLLKYKYFFCLYHCMNVETLGAVVDGCPSGR